MIDDCITSFFGLNQKGYSLNSNFKKYIAISSVVDYPRFEPLTANTREYPKTQKSNYLIVR